MIVASSEFNIRVSNSDMFLNQDVTIAEGLMRKIHAFKAATKACNHTAADEIEAILPHGILGQVRYMLSHTHTQC